MVEKIDIVVTPEMAEAGGIAHAYWRMFTDEPSEERIAESIYRTMADVGSGAVLISQVRANLGPKTGREFFEIGLATPSGGLASLT